jgi:hypothetical protein
MDLGNIGDLPSQRGGIFFLDRFPVEQHLAGMSRFQAEDTPE